MAKCFICIRDRGKMKKYCPRCRKFVYRAGNKLALRPVPGEFGEMWASDASIQPESLPRARHSCCR